MHELIGSTKITVESANNWLLNHYSLDDSEKEIMKTFLKECKDLNTFLSFDINSDIFKIVKENNTEYVILQADSLNKNKIELESLYQKHLLKNQPLILEPYNDNFLLLNYSYLSLKKSDWDDIESFTLEIFIIFFMACYKSFGVVCNSQFLLELIGKYKIPIKSLTINYLEELISKKKYIITHKIKISNSKNSSEEILRLCFDNISMIKIRSYTDDYSSDDDSDDYSDDYSDDDSDDDSDDKNDDENVLNDIEAKNESSKLDNNVTIENKEFTEKNDDDDNPINNNEFSQGNNESSSLNLNKTSSIINPKIELTQANYDNQNQGKALSLPSSPKSYLNSLVINNQAQHNSNLRQPPGLENQNAKSFPNSPKINFDVSAPNYQPQDYNDFYQPPPGFESQSIKDFPNLPKADFDVSAPSYQPQDYNYFYQPPPGFESQSIKDFPNLPKTDFDISAPSYQPQDHNDLYQPPGFESQSINGFPNSPKTDLNVSAPSYQPQDHNSFHQPLGFENQSIKSFPNSPKTDLNVSAPSYQPLGFENQSIKSFPNSPKTDLNVSAPSYQPLGFENQSIKSFPNSPKTDLNVSAPSYQPQNYPNNFEDDDFEDIFKDDDDDDSNESESNYENETYVNPEIDDLLKKADIQFRNNRGLSEIYALDIILDSILNIIIISSKELLNINIVPLDVCVKYIQMFKDIFEDELSGNIIDETYLLNYIKQRKEKIHEIIKIDNNYIYISFANEIMTDKYIQKLGNINNKFNDSNFKYNVEQLIQAIKTPKILKDNPLKAYINNYITFFPIYKDLFYDIIEILIPEDEMALDVLGSVIINNCDHKFNKNYYQFLLRASNGIESFIFKTSNHEKFFSKNENNNVFIDLSKLDNVDYKKELNKIFENNEENKNDIIVILLLIFLISYGEYDKNKNEILLLLEEIEFFFGYFTDIDYLPLISIIKEYNNGLNLLEDGYKLITFKLNNKEMQPSNFDSKEDTLRNLLNNFIFTFNKSLKEENINDFMKGYIEYFPIIQKLKDSIIQLLQPGYYNSVEYINANLKNYITQFGLSLYDYYTSCCSNSLETILEHDKDFSFYKFNGRIYCKYNQKYKENEINNINKKLDDSIVAIVKDSLPEEEDYKRLEKFEKKMKKIIMNEKQWKNYELEVHRFGSSKNGLWSNQSDIDLCIFANNSKGQYIDINMHKIAHVLKVNGMINIEPIIHTRIPICKFEDPETGFNCDLSCNNRIPIYNSELIACYMKFDERVRDIVMIVKKWAKERCINSSKDRTFSSYTFVLLCIAYFQIIDPPVLPNLQNKIANIDMFEIDVNVSNKLLNKNLSGYYLEKVRFYNDIKKISRYFISKNESSRRELLLGLFKFYGCDYHFEDVICNIRVDGSFEKVHDYLHNNKDYIFAVKDPFIKKRIINCNSGEDEKRHIINEFYRAYNILKNTNELNAIFKNDDIV
ncbi:hypothetical protein BCR36DRAFT_583293 [Piromyces finnis]|uniref:polynucleotide adenylyltransferase n=1 Tax=Piromyces finnis TaxID=1754191 RepID=A0A1Y1VB18_9FUNG|nr:hypothetical protein BCR36DRAFT_583293 [Piromyces finnis]|eukprot:ORX50707.1 hypothetical protein BCR36DRAFT_583293 [Piromyces finnis]